MANDGPTGSAPVIFAYTGIVLNGNGFADQEIINIYLSTILRMHLLRLKVIFIYFRNVTIFTEYLLLL